MLCAYRRLTCSVASWFTNLHDKVDDGNGTTDVGHYGVTGFDFCTMVCSRAFHGTFFHTQVFFMLVQMMIRQYLIKTIFLPIGKKLVLNPKKASRWAEQLYVMMMVVVVIPCRYYGFYWLFAFCFGLYVNYDVCIDMTSMSSSATVVVFPR